MRNDRLTTLKGFLDAFLQQHQERPDRPFCFILGAGASKSSGIPAGSEMAMQWLKELHQAEDFENLAVEEWATAARLEIPGFDIKAVGSFYPQLYSRRFKDREEDGYAFLESQMEGKEPSFGYSVLAYLLSVERHKMVITTNFDNLVADALSIHSNTFPIVVGHDSLAAYARVELRRPLVAKVHGGLGFQPKNQPDELCTLSSAWKEALNRIFNRYTPIVIGYDGNDGSLMTFLESLPAHTPDTVYWCFRSIGNDAKEHLKAVPERIKKFVEQKKGALVPIPGFDEMMAMLLHKLKEPLKIPDLYERLTERARKREQNYDDQQRRLFEQVNGKQTEAKPEQPVSRSDEDRAEVAKTIEAIAGQRKTKPWWRWMQEAAKESDLGRREKIYKEGVDALPDNAYMLTGYALFLLDELKDADKAEELYKRAIEADPKQANNLGNYATFLKTERKDADRAEEFYKRAIEADPKHAVSLGQYATFLSSVRKDAARAEEFYKRAIEADPKHAGNLGDYATFLSTVRKDANRAEEFYKRAIEADPKHAGNLGNYATFLKSERKDADRAEEFYKRAIEADPKHAVSLGQYATFLSSVRKDAARAEEFYKRAIEADPKHAGNLGDYATFLSTVRKDANRAEEFYKRAIEADPKHAGNLGNYATFLKSERKDADQVEIFYKRGIEADPKHANNLGQYAIFLKDERKNAARAEELYKRAIEADPKHANNLGNYTQLLFILGKYVEARKKLAEVEAIGSKGDDLIVELSFYRLAHIPESWPVELGHMKGLLTKGARSPGWNLSGNIERATKTGHPNIELLDAIADVISHNKPLGALDKFTEWKEARPSS